MSVPGLRSLARLAAVRVADAIRARAGARMGSESRRVTRISRLTRRRLFLLGLAENLEHPIDPFGRKSDQTRIGMTQLEDQKDRNPDGDRAGEMPRHQHLRVREFSDLIPRGRQKPALRFRLRLQAIEKAVLAQEDRSHLLKRELLRPA